MASTNSRLYCDALPPSRTTFPSSHRSGFDVGDMLNDLSADDFRSVLFLLIDRMDSPYDFLSVAAREKNRMKTKFFELYNDIRCKEALIIEILTIMQKYKLLKRMGLCRHIAMKDIDTFNQISHFWKCLYEVCEQLTDTDALHLERTLFPSLNITGKSAEELFCFAYINKQVTPDNLERLSEILQSQRPGIAQFISSRKVPPKETYYPIKRPTDGNPCGLAVLINNEEFFAENGGIPLDSRADSNLDIHALEMLWKRYGFLVEKHIDLTESQMKELFRSLSSRDHSDYDVFVACVLSHGDNGVVFSTDGKPVPIVDLVSVITNETPTLIDKPKLFFFQACQGSNIQHETRDGQTKITPLREYASQCPPETPLFMDYLKFSSTIPDFVSFRPSRQKSWFVEALVEVIGMDGEDLSISDMTAKVNNRVSQKRDLLEIGDTNCLRNCKQTPCVEDTLRHKLKFKKLVSS